MKYLLFLFVLLLSCTSDPIDPDVQRWEDIAKNITIYRDDFGVPHIYGKTDADAVFGLLYAQCEDDFDRVELNYIWAIGRLAEIKGEEYLYSDLRARLFMTREEAMIEYEKCPEWLKKLCVAWADGINFYLHSHPEVQPALISHFEPWMPMYFSEGSIGGDIERISTERVKAFYKENKALSLSPYNDGLTHPDHDAEPIGSNGWAISGKLTESGNAMLLINPHTSFYFRGEVHVVSEEGLNAYGAVTWGQFFVYQGFNEKTGWMHTSTYTDVIDEFAETVEMKFGKLVYKYGEDFRPVDKSTVTLQYLENDTLKPHTFAMYETHHGPITHKVGDQWVATALMWSPAKALEQSYTRTKLGGHEEFYNMMSMHTNSSNNTVYADAGGNIAYYHGNFIPRRDEKFDYTKPVDGSNPATDWNGLHTVEEAITVINPENGWIQNCNSTPYTSAAEFSPKKEDYPRYMSIDRENFRGLHAIRILEEETGWTLDKLIKSAYDSYLPGFEKIIPALVQAYDSRKGKGTNKDEELSPAIEVLRNWDFRTSEESVAMTLAHFYGMSCLQSGEIPQNLIGNNRLNFFANGASPQQRLLRLKEVIKSLDEAFGSWNIPWGEVNRFQRLTGDIDLQFDDSKPSIPIGLASGRWGALASFGARSKNTNRIYGSSGNSFVAVVEFGEKVKAKSMLAGGQSGDIDSDHFYDQAQRYADVEFKDVAYYREDVEKRAISIYTPGTDR